MQVRLREKKIGYKKEFLREIIKEVRVRGNNVSLTYRLPMTVRTPKPEGSDPQTKEFFTLYHLVEAGGIEPTSVLQEKSAKKPDNLDISGRKKV